MGKGTNYTDGQVIIFTMHSGRHCYLYGISESKLEMFKNIYSLISSRRIPLPKSISWWALAGSIVSIDLGNWIITTDSTIKIDQIIVEFPNLLCFQHADFTKKSIYCLYGLFSRFEFIPFVLPSQSPLPISEKLFALCFFPVKSKVVFPAGGGMLGS